jgi:hypothetical protein
MFLSGMPPLVMPSPPRFPKESRFAFGPVHPAYNPSFSACFFSRNNIFLSQQISQQYFSAGLSAQPNGAFI